MNLLRLIFTLLASILLFAANAQKSIIMKTEHWEQSFEWGEKSRLFINGEQADIAVKSYKGDLLKCAVTRTARHSDEEQAAQDLGLFKLLQSQTGRTVNIRNYIELESSQKRPESNLKCTYLILIPEKAIGQIEIWNYFGKVTIEKINCELDLKLEFCDLKMSRYSGTADLKIIYGDGILTEVAGELTMNINRSSIELQYIKAATTIASEYAELRLINIYDPKILNIKARRSDVFLDIPSQSMLTYDILTSNVEVQDPSGRKMKRITEPDGRLRLSFTPREAQRQASISLDTGTINYIVQ